MVRFLLNEISFRFSEYAFVAHSKTHLSSVFFRCPVHLEYIASNVITKWLIADFSFSADVYLVQPYNFICDNSTSSLLLRVPVLCELAKDPPKESLLNRLFSPLQNTTVIVLLISRLQNE